ncbi:MAG: 4-hydroxy-3-methylbut-2-enyl diphosphate reductase [Clostridia bacterium]|nr:4-hydroxy-3-methylbut-2-enyl diphosphate reductase [Clostridia bacterium]
MEIIVGKTAGFCYGVKRAVEGATTQAIQEENQSIYCLGEIVHNKEVIKKLENLGIKCIETIGEANGIVLIRAHGVPKELYEIAKKMNLTIQDFTCPNVLKVHKIADEYRKKGYFIFLLGAKNHPENIGTLSYCGQDCYIFEEEEEFSKAFEKFEKTGKKKLLLISQTTYSLEKFEKIQEKLQKQIKADIEVVIKNTICRTTELRQKETVELAKKVDTMIVIGGKNSSNTKKIYEIAKKNCEHTILIENAEELNLKTENIRKIGIMAGASTPKESIDEVITAIQAK